MAPPRSLLRWLVQSLNPPKDETAWGSKETRKKREALVRGDQRVINEALELLSRANLPDRAWYILEGYTYPDVYIETQSMIIVIEGKRTEKEPTTTTTWMPNRHQMLRHLDCAWEVRGRRQVFAFFIVEGKGGKTPKEWIEAAKNTVSDQTLKDSLPHRTQEEQKEIVQGFLGVTTWQRVCSEFQIDWNSLPDKC